MSKLGLVLLPLLLAHIMSLQAMANDESEAPLPGVHPSDHKPQKGVQIHDQNKTDKSEDHPVSGATESSSSEEEQGESKEAEAPISHIRRLGKHHSTDESVAGGGVIIGGLVTTIFAAVFCYIRVTRKRDTECIRK